MVSTRTISLKRVVTSIMRLERIKLEEEKDGQDCQVGDIDHCPQRHQDLAGLFVLLYHGVNVINKFYHNITMQLSNKEL